VPPGRYAPELAVFAQVAKKGAFYLPEIGYHWIQRPGGLHTKPQSHHALVASATWAYRNT